MGGTSSKVVAKPEELTNFGKIAAFIQRVMKPISTVGVAIAATMTAAMMFLTFFDVCGRAILNRPITGSLEMTEFMMSLLVSFGIGYTAYRRGHIRVDLLMQYTSKKANAWFDVFTYLVSFIFYALITWQCFNNAVSQFNSKLTSSVLFIPVYPFIFMLVIGAAILTLILFKDFVKSIDEVKKL